MGRVYWYFSRMSILVVTLVAMFVRPSPAFAATYTVNSLGDGDDGICSAAHCSLREAVNAANANPGPDTITFNIGGTPPHILVLDSVLELTDDGTTIDGTTEPDYAGAPVVVLEASDPSVVWSGIWIESSGNVVRGLSIVGFNAPASGNSGGIMIWDGSGNLVEGNYIGIYPSGVVGGNNAGIRVVAPQPQSILNNVISGNDIGIDLLSGGHDIHGNLIGLDASGATAVGNGTGVKVLNFNATSGSYGTAPIVVGGMGVGQGNVISGNGLGINLISASDVNIAGNYIGTDISGTSAVGNVIGIQLSGTSGVVIDGGNIISGNDTDGIFILQGSDGNQVMSNTIGLDVGGNPLGNGGVGVRVAGDNNQIGDVGQGNVISANAGGGVNVTGGSNHQIRGNAIGEDASGNPAGNGEAAANIGAGVIIQDGDNVNVSQNTIAYNGWMGIQVINSNNTLISENQIYQNNSVGVQIHSGTGNTISQNSMHENGAIGIDLVGSGDSLPYVTLNDSGDADSGPNTLLNYPEFTAMTPSLVEGAACIDCVVELFLPDGDPSGYGEGEVFLGSGVATGGNFSIDTSGAGLAPCAELTATATDPSGNTSEFSPNTPPPGLACQEFSKFLPPIIVLVPGFVVGGWVYYRRRKPGPAAGGFFVGIVFGVLVLLLGPKFTNLTPPETDSEGQAPPAILEQDDSQKDTPTPTNILTLPPTVTLPPGLTCEGVLGVSLLENGGMRTSVRVVGVSGQYDATLANNDILCQAYDAYPDMLLCDSPRPQPGTWVTLTVFDSQGEAFCEETFSSPSKGVEKTCSPPPGGCGNPKQGYFWAENKCQCDKCPTGGVYDTNLGKCVKP